MRKGTTLDYMHQDHLTGTAVVSDSSGALVSSIKYYPYGETRSGSVPTDKKFTGQRLDSTGLYYYGARYYDPTIGRFISADTVVPSPTNPQAFNRYSYVLNNPLKYVDPSGHLSGTVRIDGVTYTVVDEGNGIHHLEAPDGSATASVPLADLIQMISVEMMFRGDYSYGGDQYSGAAVGINVQTDYWGNPSYLVTFTPNGVWSPASALGVGGVSVGPFGVFIRYQGKSSAELEQLTLHEIDHRVWQGRMGFIPWYVAYYGEMLVDWAYYGGDYWSGPYVTNSWEQSARRMAGQGQEPNPTPWWQPYWNGFTKTAANLATDVVDFFKNLWPW